MNSPYSSSFLRFSSVLRGQYNNTLSASHPQLITPLQQNRTIFKFIEALRKSYDVRGFWGTLRAAKMAKVDTLQYLVHKDSLGNMYFENKNESYGRDRWVEYPEARHIAFDAVKIDPEWHAWLHHTIDEPPINTTKPFFQGDIRANRTGTKDLYVSRHHPLSKNYVGRAKPKYEAWVPGSTSSPNVSEGKDIYDLK